MGTSSYGFLGNRANRGASPRHPCILKTRMAKEATVAYLRQNMSFPHAKAPVLLAVGIPSFVRSVAA